MIRCPEFPSLSNIFTPRRATWRYLIAGKKSSPSDKWADFFTLFMGHYRVMRGKPCVSPLRVRRTTRVASWVIMRSGDILPERLWFRQPTRGGLYVGLPWRLSIVADLFQVCLWKMIGWTTLKKHHGIQITGTEHQFQPNSQIKLSFLEWSFPLFISTARTARNRFII